MEAQEPTETLEVTIDGDYRYTDKRERLISDEVAQDQPLYEFSLDDILAEFHFPKFLFKK